MAIRLDASGDNYSRTTGLPGITSFTIMGWVYISVDTNNWGWFFKYGVNNSPTLQYLIGVDGTGTILDSWNSASEITGTTLSVATWYHVAMVVAGTGAGQFTVYLNGVLDITNNGHTQPLSEQIIFGDHTTTGNEPFNGRLAAVKIYAAALSAAEINQERWFYVPVRTANLNAWYPLLSLADDEVDFSGNGNNLTVNGTKTMEDGPPIQWRAPARRRWYPLAAAAAASLLPRRDPMVHMLVR